MAAQIGGMIFALKSNAEISEKFPQPDARFFVLQATRRQHPLQENAMRQFTTTAAPRKTGLALIIALVGLVALGAFGAFLVVSNNKQGAPIKGAVERPVVPGSVSR
ncbi:MAG: hypothetical protein IT462_01730 [Planctomycetes bacterium]|nr:hypothetical protein [Planctomycetota bacterium]